MSCDETLSCARLGLIDLEMHRALGGLVPVELHVVGVGIGAHDRRRPARTSCRTVAISGPVTRNCTGKPIGGPFSSRADARAQRVEYFVSQDRVEIARQMLAVLDALGGDHELREVGRRELLIERQVEARRAGADEVDVMIDFRTAFQHRGFEALAPRASVAANEAPSGSRRSTSSSGRSELGKNCCGTSAERRQRRHKNATTVTTSTRPR